jgi:hypothetical protein
MGSEPTPAAAAPRGFAQDVVDLYVAPDDAFKSLISKRVWWLGVLLFMALNLAFTGYWQQKVDARGFMEAQIEESGRADQIPPERREAVVDQQLKFFNVFVWLGPLVFTPLFVFASAAVYLFIFRFFYAGELDYLTAVCVCSFAYLAVGLIQSPLILLTIVLKGDWTINPQEALLAGPAAPPSAPPARRCGARQHLGSSTSSSRWAGRRSPAEPRGRWIAGSAGVAFPQAPPSQRSRAVPAAAGAGARLDSCGGAARGRREAARRRAARTPRRRDGRGRRSAAARLGAARTPSG